MNLMPLPALVAAAQVVAARAMQGLLVTHW